MTNDEALMQVVAMLAREGIAMRIEAQDGALSAWFEDGFYKSDGMARLVVEGGNLLLLSRYGQRDEIGGLDDIARCSREWHESSKVRYAGWAVPPAHWLRAYERLEA